MTSAEEGAYIRLLAISWNAPDCGLPDNDEQLAILSRLNGAWKGSSSKLKACFIEKNGRLYNKRLLSERKKQKLWREKCSLGGQHSGRARKAMQDKELQLRGSSSNVGRVVQVNGNTPSPSSSPSPSSNNNISVGTKKAPTEAEIRKIEKREAKKKEVQAYMPLVEKLSNIISAQKDIKISGVQLNEWAKSFYALNRINAISQERMESALVFYAEHVGEEYMPVIESGKIFRQKFTKLEDAMKRLDYKPPAPAETDQAILEYAKEFNRIGGFSAELEDVDRIRVVVEDNCGGSKGWTRVIKAAKQLKTKRMIDYE